MARNKKARILDGFTMPSGKHNARPRVLSSSESVERGFTLIELLVVIGLIGILSAVVLAGLSAARSKGNDATIKSNLANLRPQAEVFSDSNNYSYAGGTGIISVGAACPTSLPANLGSNFTVMGNLTFFNAVMSAKAAGGGACAYISGTDYWAVAIQYKEPTNKAWCIDSTGTVKETVNGNFQSSPPYTDSMLAADISTAGCGS